MGASNIEFSINLKSKYQLVNIIAKQKIKFQLFS